jgi:hypothetical protein
VAGPNDLKQEAKAMALHQFSKPVVILLAAICALCGFMAGSSSSQQNRPATQSAEVGRYQAINNGHQLFVFDTRTAQFWKRESRNLENLAGIESRWEKVPGPLEPPEVKKNPPPEF